MAEIARYTAGGITLVHSIDERPSDRSFPLHMHDFYELYCFVSGKASYMVEGNLYELRPGTVLIMRSSETHKIIINGGERYERYTIHFYPEVLHQKGVSNTLLAPFKSRALGEKNIYSADECDGHSLLDIILKMCRECQSSTLLSTQEILYFNFLSILSAITHAFEHYPENAVYTKERNIDRELLNYINDNITDELSIEHLCNYVHISPSQLSRRFKELTGTTVYQYILSKRLIFAQRQIAKGKSAVQAAQESGFGDYSCFYRMYKKRFGYAPLTEKKAKQN